MQSIAFHILKGGVGKTSLSGNIAYALSRKEKTLLVDCDIQSNASRWFFPNEAKFELADVLQAKCDVEEALVGLSNKFLLLPTKSKNSSLKTYSETQLFNEPFIFEDLLSELNKLTFKHVVFDLSPSISQLERCVLLAIDEVVTPLTPEYDCCRARKEDGLFQKANPKEFRVCAIVISIVQNTFGDSESEDPTCMQFAQKCMLRMLLNQLMAFPSQNDPSLTSKG